MAKKSVAAPLATSPVLLANVQKFPSLAELNEGDFIMVPAIAGPLISEEGVSFTERELNLVIGQEKVPVHVPASMVYEGKVITMPKIGDVVITARKGRVGNITAISDGEWATVKFTDGPPEVHRLKNLKAQA